MVGGSRGAKDREIRAINQKRVLESRLMWLGPPFRKPIRMTMTLSKGPAR